MEDIIYITGHKNPDTDSICSAICYAELKNKLGNTKAKAVRLGSISKETQYALENRHEISPGKVRPRPEIGANLTPSSLIIRR